MDLKNLITTWKEYQKWLKDQGINSSNIQQKILEFVEKLKENPEKFEQVQSILNNKNIMDSAQQLNIDESKINEVKSIFNSTASNKRSGNLTAEQLEMLRKFKR